MTDKLVNYPGSRVLEGLSSYTSLDVDQLNFVVSQLVALGLAGLYRTVLGPAKVNSTIRHIFGLVFGIWMAYFCFGYHALHLAGLPAVCYLVIQTQSPSIMHGAVLFTAMLYLSAVHLHRQLFEDSSYGLDISGPLMVIMQKVTSLAFSLHDGLSKSEDEMTETQKQYAIRKLPTLLEYFGYSLMFPSLMAGPMLFYKDYIEFIEGRVTVPRKKPASNVKEMVVRDPNPARAVVKKVILATVCALVFVLLLPKFPMARVKDAPFLERTTFSYKFWYLTVATSLVRAKYYFAWTLADAVCNNAGLGWDGENWNRFTNVDIFRFEFGTNLKETIDGWNRGTNAWLRFIVYGRIAKYRTFVTFALSAIWHGFYPGYYLTFLGAALFTFAARTMRRHVRPYFVASNESKLLYDVVTFATTRLVIAYLTFPFVLLEFGGAAIVYGKLYWAWHIAAALVIVAVPKIVGKPDPVVVETNGQKNGIAFALSKAGPYSDAMSKID